MCDNHPVALRCVECGSEDLLKDAFARWDVNTQQWVLDNVFDQVICNTCGYESKHGQTDQRIIPAI